MVPFAAVTRRAYGNDLSDKCCELIRLTPSRSILRTQREPLHRSRQGDCSTMPEAMGSSRFPFSSTSSSNAVRTISARRVSVGWYYVGQSVAQRNFHGGRKTSKTRSTGQNRYQEALRKRPNHIERSCFGCWISEGSLVRSPLGHRDRRFHL